MFDSEEATSQIFRANPQQHRKGTYDRVLTRMVLVNACGEICSMVPLAPMPA